MTLRSVRLSRSTATSCVSCTGGREAGHGNRPPKIGPPKIGPPELKVYAPGPPEFLKSYSLMVRTAYDTRWLPRENKQTKNNE